MDDRLFLFFLYTANFYVRCKGFTCPLFLIILFIGFLKKKLHVQNANFCHFTPAI